MRLGTWVTVFSEQKVLSSKNNADRLLDIADKCGIKDIYVQVYRSDKAYYNSSITDASPYKTFLSEANTDVFKYLTERSKERGISIHAWINLLSLAKNKEANILKTLGKSSLTIDQHGKDSLKDPSDPLDKYYIREDQLFLEPGSKEVRKYLSGIVQEITGLYPDMAGIHLDYIRYPSVVPFIPGSRFTSHGIGYGYGKDNLDAFKASSEIDMLKDGYSRKKFLEWDAWLRGNVTSLVKEISETVHRKRPDLKISCAVMPSIERTYLTTFQDWTSWLENGYLDYVVAMDYTDDPRLFGFYANSFIAQAEPSKVQLGVGAYLLKDQSDILYSELNRALAAEVSGLVIFSYDDIAEDPALQAFLAENFK